MRVLTVADLHQHWAFYDQLAVAVSAHKPDVVACVGDFLDGNYPPRSGSLPPWDAAFALADLPCEVVFTRGNHEDEGWTDFEETWITTGRPLHALHGSGAAFGPLNIIGFPCWLGRDHFYASGRQLSNYDPDTWLTRLLRKTGPAGRALWLMHEPPCPELVIPIGNPEWHRAVVQYQPLVTVSGHDHSTPLRTSIWKSQLGRTVCINAGQRDPTRGDLICCTIDFSFDRDGIPRVEKIERLGV